MPTKFSLRCAHFYAFRPNVRLVLLCAQFVASSNVANGPRISPTTFQSRPTIVLATTDAPSIVPRAPTARHLAPISNAHLKILDVCCGEGGVSRGLRAAFPNATIVGLDLNAHPLKRYLRSGADSFIQADALEYLASEDAARAQYDFIWASFPCQSFTPLRALDQTKHYPDLIPEGRALLQALNPTLGYILENVPTATFAQTMRNDVTLCGNYFGLRTYRHRIFESPLALIEPPHSPHLIRTTTINRKAQYEAGAFITITGHVGSYCGPAMGIDWMTGRGLSQAIPPVYAHYLAQFIPVPAAV